MIRRKISKKRKMAKTTGQRYPNEQLYPHLMKCFGPHQYTSLILAGPMSIPAKICKCCSFILYKDQLLERNKKLRENRPKQHIDLFQF